jgi:hypothetical protein
MDKITKRLGVVEGTFTALQLTGTALRMLVL